MHGQAKIHDVDDASNVFLGRFNKISTFPFKYLSFYIESEPIHHGQMPFDATINISFSVGSSRYTCNAKLIVGFRNTLICRIPDKTFSVERRITQRFNLYEPFEVFIDFSEQSEFFTNHLEQYQLNDNRSWVVKSINLSADGIGLRINNLKRSFLPFLGQEFAKVKLFLSSPQGGRLGPYLCHLKLKNVAIREESRLQEGEDLLIKNRFAYCGFQFINKSDELISILKAFIAEINGAKAQKRGAS